MVTQEQTLEHISLPLDVLEPNPWNPNVMDPDMFVKEVESIRMFGFVDPLTVRQIGPDRYQIIDGEHRLKAGKSLGMVKFPCVRIEVDEETAKQLTIVLNETRGSPDEVKLAALVRDLAQRRDATQLQRVMPFSAERLRELINPPAGQIDWDALREKRDQMRQERSRWVEKVYRMPAEAAEVIDQAVERVMSEEGLEHEWRALEMIAADSLAK